MFKEAISGTPLTTDTANLFYGNAIPMCSILGDATFVSTLRALVYPRMGKDDVINLRYDYGSLSAEDVKRLSINRILNHTIDNALYPGSIAIYNFCHPDDASNMACFELHKSSFVEQFPEWVKIEKVTQFFQAQKFPVLCFVNPEIKSVMIYTCKLTIKKLHRLQTAMLALFPWYFDPEQGVTELERELIESLKLSKPDAYLTCLDKIASSMDFRAENIKRQLSGFETVWERREIESVQSSINEAINRINRYSNEIADALDNKRVLDIKLLGLKARIAQAHEESELMRYFISNPKLDLIRANDRGGMTFVARSYLTYFNENTTGAAINNPGSYMYEYNSVDHGDMKMLLTAIFLDQTLRVKICAAYKFNLRGEVSALEDFNYGWECREYTPNPHIDAHSCLGGHRTYITECLKNNNYIGAIEQCIASCESLNTDEFASMHYFLERLYGVRTDKNIRCIELPDGRTVTPKEAIEYLKEKKSNGENN